LSLLVLRIANLLDKKTGPKPNARKLSKHHINFEKATAKARGTLIFLVCGAQGFPQSGSSGSHEPLEGRSSLSRQSFGKLSAK
jgi:hypothetical protein